MIRRFVMVGLIGGGGGCEDDNCVVVVDDATGCVVQHPVVIW